MGNMRNLQTSHGDSAAVQSREQMRAMMRPMPMTDLHHRTATAESGSSPPLSQPTAFDLDQAKGKPKWRPIVRGSRMDVPRNHPEVHLRATSANLWVFAPPHNHHVVDGKNMCVENFRFCLQCIDGFVKVRGALLHDLMGERGVAPKRKSKAFGNPALRGRVEAAPTEAVKNNQTHAVSEALAVPADAKMIATKCKARGRDEDGNADDDGEGGEMGVESLEDLLSGAFTTRDLEL